MDWTPIITAAISSIASIAAVALPALLVYSRNRKTDKAEREARHQACDARDDERNDILREVVVNVACNGDLAYDTAKAFRDGKPDSSRFLNSIVRYEALKSDLAAAELKRKQDAFLSASNGD